MRGVSARGVIVIAAGLAAFAVSASANQATLSFSTTNNGGKFALSQTSPFALSSVAGGYNILFNTLMVGGDSTAGDNGTYTLNSSSCSNGSGGFSGAGNANGAVMELSGVTGSFTLTLWGAFSGTVPTALQNLQGGCFQLATLSGAFTGNFGGSSGNFGFAGLAANGLAANSTSTLFADLGISGDAVSLGNGAGFLGTGGTSNAGVETYNASSQQFALTATPEPVSFLLGSAGLVFVLLFARRNRRLAATVRADC